MNGATNAVGRASSEADSINPLTAAQRGLLGVFLLAIGLVIAQTFGLLKLPVSPGISDGIVIVLALASTLVSLAGQLPAQNVALAAVIVGILGGAVHVLGAFTGIPFGPINYAPESGVRLLGTAPWFMPLLWIIAILNARGVARLILRPWRKLRIYGYWLIGITTLLTLIFVLGMEPFATHARHYWFWGATKLSVDWYGTPLSDFLGWVVAALLILAFSTPALMKKKPSRSYPEYHPLIVWTAIQVLFIAGAVSQHLPVAAIVTAATGIVVLPFAIRGANW
jgi:uncharacterized membrane protein